MSTGPLLAAQAGSGCIARIQAVQNVLLDVSRQSSPQLRDLHAEQLRCQPVQLLLALQSRARVKSLLQGGHYRVCSEKHTQRLAGQQSCYTSNVRHIQAQKGPLLTFCTPTKAQCREAPSIRAQQRFSLSIWSLQLLTS